MIMKKLLLIILCSLLIFNNLRAQEEELEVEIANNGISGELLGLAVGLSVSYHHYFRLGQDNFLDLRLGAGTAWEGYSIHNGLTYNIGGNSKFFKVGLVGNYMADDFLDSGYGLFGELGFCYQKPWGGFTYGITLYPRIVGSIDPTFMVGLNLGYTF